MSRSSKREPNSGSEPEPGRPFATQMEKLKHYEDLQGLNLAPLDNERAALERNEVKKY